MGPGRVTNRHGVLNKLTVIRQIKPKSRSALLFGLVCIVLTSGCADSAKDPADIEREINALLLDGQLVPAEQRCKEAIRSDPGNPDLRSLYGEVQLAAGNGEYAEIAFRKAIELGADASRLHTRIARALFLQEQYLAVLNMEAPATALTESAQMQLSVIRLRAALQLPGGESPEVHRTARNLFRSLDSKNNVEPWVVSLRSEMQALADSNAFVANAYEHARCSTPPAATYVSGRTTISDGTEESVIRVGSTRSIKTPAEAARVATDGSIVLIDAENYSGGVARWPQSDITILGMGGRPHIKAAGRAIDDRDIWLFTGDNIVVENIEFSGARSTKYKNGAGIRHMGSNLTVRHGYFHDSDNGILTWKAPSGEITIEFSEFARNGFGDGQSHNVYIGETRRLTFQYNYSHSAKEGHLLKSRASINDIRYNRLTGEGGRVSYVIDLPNGGIAYVVGNEIEKAVESRNPFAISFGQEGLTSDENRLFVVHNSVYNRYDKTILIRNAAKSPVFVANNLIGGAPTGLVTGEYTAEGNQNLPDHGMVNPREYDFHLLDAARAIDNGIEIDSVSSGQSLLPVAEYVHPVSMRSRNAVAQPDVGAHEYCAE